MNEVSFSLSDIAFYLKYSVRFSHCSIILLTAICRDSHLVWAMCKILCGFTSKDVWNCRNSLCTMWDVSINVSNKIAHSRKLFGCLGITKMYRMANKIWYCDVGTNISEPTAHGLFENTFWNIYRVEGRVFHVGKIIKNTESDVMFCKKWHEFNFGSCCNICSAWGRSGGGE